MAKNGLATDYDDAGFPATAASTTPITAASTTVLKAGPGRLIKVVVTASAAGVVTVYDNATTNSGTVLFATPASPAVGTIYTIDLPAVNGLTVVAASTPSSVTIGWS
jgi:hypothetical protein